MFFTDKAARAFLDIIGKADCFQSVGGKQTQLRVLMPNDVTLMDTTSTDYNGRVCLVASPEEHKDLYQRVFIEGDTAIICDPTDGEENGRCKVDELKVEGIVTAIVRKLEPEEPIDMEPLQRVWGKITQCRHDPLLSYYGFKDGEIAALKKKHKGAGCDCIISGFFYGFAEGRRAEQAKGRRERRAARKKQSA